MRKSGILSKTKALSAITLTLIVILASALLTSCTETAKTGGGAESTPAKTSAKLTAAAIREGDVPGNYSFSERADYEDLTYSYAFYNIYINKDGTYTERYSMVSRSAQAHAGTDVNGEGTWEVKEGRLFLKVKGTYGATQEYKMSGNKLWFTTPGGIDVIFTRDTIQ